MDGLIRPNMRPDKSGLLVYGMKTRLGQAIGIKELKPEASRTPEAQEMIDALVLDDRLIFILEFGGGRRAVGSEKHKNNLFQIKARSHIF